MVCLRSLVKFKIQPPCNEQSRTYPIEVPPYRMQVFVEVTPSRMLPSTPSKQHTKGSMASSDLGGYGSEDEQEYAKRREMMLNGHSTGKKTGERDERGQVL